MGKKKRCTKEQILSHLKAFDKSGLSVTAYCKKHSIAYTTFYKWRSRYKLHLCPGKPGQSFVALDIAPESIQDENVIAKIQHRNGSIISFYQHCPIAFMAETIKQL